MNQSVSRLSAGLLLSGTLIFASCSKNNDKSNDQTPVEKERTAAVLQADASSEILFDDVFNNVMGVSASVGMGETGEFQSRKSGVQLIAKEAPCYTVKMEFINAPDTFPVKVTIDFGDSCKGYDGRVRKGKIITVYSGHLLRPGSVAETSFDNYSVNGIKVEGTHRVENKSNSTHLVFETKVTDGKLTNASGDFIEWNRTRTISQVDGWGTPWIPGDDVYTIVGNGSGTIQRGDFTTTWTSTNLEPLVKRFNCRWIVRGKQAIQRNGGPEGILDFGKGDCDNLATIVVNGVSIEITLN
jgi:hypothetical protein